MGVEMVETADSAAEMVEMVEDSAAEVAEDSAEGMGQPKYF